VDAWAGRASRPEELDEDIALYHVTTARDKVLSSRIKSRAQLRAQVAARGCPIVGDRLYGSRLPFPEPGGIALHAARLAFDHPISGAEIALASHVGPSWPDAFPSLFPPRAST
jgi:hypothetical protein